MKAASPAPTEPGPLFTELNTRRLGPIRRYFLRHPVTTDVVVAACFAVPGALLAAATSDRPRLPLFALVLAGFVVLLWRRRQPVWTAAAIGALGVVSLATTGTIGTFDTAVGLVIYAVAAARRPRTAWLALIALCLAVSGAFWLWDEPMNVAVLGITTDASESATETRVSAITAILIFALAAMAIGSSVRNRREHVSALIDRANRLAVERDHEIQLASAAERARIAREMHDVVAHSLSVMIALADGAGVALNRSPDRAREAIAEVSETGRSALADMRRVLGALRDPQAPLGPQPGAGDLAGLVEGFRSAGLPVRTTVTGTPVPTDAGIQLAVYRIVQESLTNVLRHAVGAGQVDVLLATADGWIEITVTDDGGAGISAAARAPSVLGERPATGAGSGGRGIIGMRERAAVYGGVVDAGPYRAGWRTRARLAWTEEDR
ncbi:sensor histidine kinase [Pengzhenrongella sicca]|uniref:histidine kinase n=1 Tax=Pengzhenrongella sicca TaxID=2819238 RepID=A0A8A4ZCX3_9MICO|nr:histidine kinase [Pengzhenrongella sicca]QTE28869.1 two-component sensor histidine kinase [Pengzhenrongella sicca]